MRVDRWRDNIHGRGASRLSLKASREISQFLQANETDGDMQRVFSLSPPPPSLFLVLIHPPAIRVSFFHHRVAFSISCALFAVRHCPFFFHFLLRNLFSSRRISPLISNRHCASTYDVRLFPRISLLLFANYSRICR